MKHLTMELVNQSLKLIIADKHYFPRKTGSCARNVGESSSRSNVFLKYFNYNYMEFVGYDTCDKLIWTSGEGIIITNRIRKQGIPKTHINKISPS